MDYSQSKMNLQFTINQAGRLPEDTAVDTRHRNVDTFTTILHAKTLHELETCSIDINFSSLVTDLKVQFTLRGCLWTQEKLHALEERHSELDKILPEFADSIRIM